MPLSEPMLEYCQLDPQKQISMKSYIFIQENLKMSPDSKVHGANMWPIWGRHDPGGPHELCYLGRQDDGSHFVLATMC